MSRVFKTRHFSRWMRKTELMDSSLCAAVLEIPKPALFLAGKAFVQYRRSGGVKNNVLGDFLSAHTLLSAGCRC